jgi:hypothetical protein
MNDRPFPRSGALSPAASRIERQKWRDYLDEAARLAAFVQDGGSPDRDAIFRLQRHLFRGAGATGFPIPGVAGRTIAEALQKLLQAFLTDGAKDFALVGAAADLVGRLRGLLDAETEAAAEVWRRQFPD